MYTLEREVTIMSAFDKIIGYTNIVKELVRIADVLRDPAPYTRLGARAPRGLLLHGVPGVGKSLMAECLIEESGRKVFICRKTQSDGAFIDTIRETFAAAAKSAPSIVFLDDLDKFSDHEEDRSNEEEFAAVQACIDEVRKEDVFILATANDIDELPRSLTRAGRFDRIIQVDAPKTADSEQIIAHYLKKLPTLENMNIEEAAATIANLIPGHSCADLETAVNEAALLAGQNGLTYIPMSYLIRACLLTAHGVSPDSIECYRTDDPDDPGNRMTNAAWHEAGHAVVAETLSPGSVTLVCIHEETNDSLGFTSYAKSPRNHNLLTRSNEIVRTLGGRAAQELRFGLADLGAESDLEDASCMLSDLINAGGYGFSLLNNPYRGYSEALRARREIVMASELERLYLRAKEILSENRDFLNALTVALLEEGYLTGEEVRALKEEVTSRRSAC